MTYPPKSNKTKKIFFLSITVQKRKEKKTQQCIITTWNKEHKSLKSENVSPNFSLKMTPQIMKTTEILKVKLNPTAATVTAKTFD